MALRANGEALCKWSANAERRHLAPGTRAVVFGFYAKASAAWEQVQQEAQEEANRKKSEAARGNQNASKTRDETSRASIDAPLVSPPEEQPKPKKSRDDKTSTKKSKAAGVSENTMERAHVLDLSQPPPSLPHRLSLRLARVRGKNI